MEPAKNIKAIDRSTVHRICSGQVVLTLATAVKELVENSLDAGATSVDVRLKDYGASMIEVNDNGSGVDEADFEGLTLKHHTSKLRNFEGLDGVNTFGFRGEALSSLCALGNVTITTRSSGAPIATRLAFSHSGSISERGSSARLVGTSVCVQNLFSTLPVRYKEFQRNIKKEFNKMVHVLYSYCIISTGVRITCTNQTEKGKKTTVVSTTGHPSIKDNISAIFGAKQASSLLEFEQTEPSEETLKEFGITNAVNNSQDLILEGYISSCAHGQGRPSPDRQFYFVNNRPCDPAKVSKVINEVYRQYNRHQSPCVVLNLRIGQSLVDVNLTPDKRQVLLAPERMILATLKTSMIQLYENIPSTYRVNTSPMVISSPSTLNTHSPTTPRLSALTHRFARGGSPGQEVSPGGLKRCPSTPNTPINKQPNLLSFFKRSQSSQEKIESSQESTQSSQKSFNSTESEMQQSQESEMQPSPESEQNLDITKLEMQHSQESEQNFNSNEKSELNLNTDSQHSQKTEQNFNSHEKSELNLNTASQHSQKTELNFNSHEKSEQNLNITESDMEINGDIQKINGVENLNGVEIVEMEVEEIENSNSSFVNSNGDSSNSNLLNGNNYNSNLNTDGTRDNEMSIGVSTKNSLAHFASPAAKSSSSSSRSSSSLKVSNSLYISPAAKRAHTLTSDFLSNLANKRKKNNGENFGTLNQNINGKINGNAKNLDNFGSLDQNSKEIEILYDENYQNQDNFETQDNFNSQNSQNQDNFDPLTQKLPPKKVIFEERHNIDSRRTKGVDFDIESIRVKLSRAKLRQDKGRESRRRFKAKISPSDNSSAEEELKREFTKEMFGKMQVLGQFNLGFIIAKLDSDIFIVDQHASDEKYNFETLQRTCSLHSQRSVVPQRLELTPTNETILLDNLHVFRKCGFEFIIDEESEASRKGEEESEASQKWGIGENEDECMVEEESEASQKGEEENEESEASKIGTVKESEESKKWGARENEEECMVEEESEASKKGVAELSKASEKLGAESSKASKKGGAIAGRRVSLVSKPVSRGWEFGREDVEEMIFMLSDAPGVDCRPSRFRAMFASRACRSSVMIGTALSLSQMKRLLDHMGTMQHPWNCPHGRPTMRHLVCLDMINT